ncbi:MAG: rhamnulokinase [Fermentimonas sp.]|jgi:rhamnulokinase|nr:rhamnulokinase [Fermentimonas sp.]
MNRGNLNFLAIDIGAGSGRAILGTIQNEKIELKEVNRFSNPMIEVNDLLYWDILYLYDQIIKSIIKVNNTGVDIASIGIDTWGVDYVCFGSDGKPLRMPSTYRNINTAGAPERFYSKIAKKELYRKTGIQIMDFNTLFQLDTQLHEKSSIYPLIDKILFTPDALSYMLTGNMVTEYTIASTSQLINPYKRDFDTEILESIGLSKDHFAPIVFSGKEIGKINNSVKKATGLQNISVVAVAGHDTASAVLAVPAENENFAYLSSGTWSLMGIESKEPVINEETYSLNITNEGGADGSIRLLKNICGMWLIEQCRKEWEKVRPVSFDEIIDAAAQTTPYTSLINPDAKCFANPDSMIDTIQEYCRDTNQAIPQTIGEISRCIYESLAFRYKQVLMNLQKLADFPIQKLHIIGGGSKNNMLNQFTANAIGMPVIAGPSEATAVGNILMQAKASGIVDNKSEMRKIVRNSTTLEAFNPTDIQLWDENYQRYLEVFQEN